MKFPALLLFPLAWAVVAPAQNQREPEIPLQLAGEAEAVAAQDTQFNRALEPSLKEAARSTVRIWSGRRKLAYGTVVGTGTTILTKWSQIANQRDRLVVDPGDGSARTVIIKGVYEDEDLAVLELDSGNPLVPVKWAMDVPTIGSFIAAPQPDGRAAGFGVISVNERNLRFTDKAFLGIEADITYTGNGVRVGKVEADSGAFKAGLRTGHVLLKFEDRIVSGVLELRNAMNGLKPGMRINVLAMTPGGEKTFEVLLGSGKEMQQFPGDRLAVMERMGGPVSAVRDGFPNAVQTDMRLAPDEMGGPVVDLQGRVLGITLARADRTRSFFMPATDIIAMLGRQAKGPDLAKTRVEEAPPLAMRMPRDRNTPKPPRLSRGRALRHFEEMESLMDHLEDEMSALEMGR
ncbi:MAG: PDZ domain-containing protein [Verrucomicrobiota bacterium]